MNPRILIVNAYEPGGFSSPALFLLPSLLAEQLKDWTPAYVEMKSKSAAEMICKAMVRDNSDLKTVIWFSSNHEFSPKRFNKKIVLLTALENAPHEPLDIVAHALTTRSNLLISERDGKLRLVDPLGNSFCLTDDPERIARFAGWRLRSLIEMRRAATVSLNKPPVEIPENEEFYSFVRNLNSTLTHTMFGERYVGNASFRCTKGFPSFKEGETIFVSKRNVDKKHLDREDFVPVPLDGDHSSCIFLKSLCDGREVLNKPSVDSPVQAMLYRYYGKVRYMLHTHTYIEGAPFTDHVIPCGALNEYEEILSLFPENTSVNFSINLRGHGSLSLAGSVEYLISLALIPRTIWEEQDVESFPSTV